MHHKQHLLASGIVTALLSHSPLVQSQVSNVSDEEIIVTASRLPESRFDALSASAVITREQIESRMATSLFELLGTNAGIQTTRTGGDGSQTSLFMRGSNSDHTLILIDGIKANTASEGFARLEHLAPEQIERIEIVRGGHSSVHGADAIGGVIQVFTRQAQETAGIGGQLQGSIGSHASRRANASLDLGNNRTQASIHYSHQQTDGIRPRNAPTPSAQRSAYDNDSINLDLQHRISNDASMQASFRRSDSGLVFDGGNSDNRHQNFSIGGSLDISEQWLSTLRLARFQDNNHTYDGAPANNRTHRDSLHWFNHLQLDGQRELGFGFDHEEEELYYESNITVQTSTRRDNSAVFALYQQQLSAVTTSLSLRHDQNQQFGGRTTGRGAMAYSITADIDIWYAYSTAFRAPNLVNLYVDFPQFWFYANPDLKPETASNHELALRGHFQGTRWSVNLFQNEISNLIASNATFDSLTNIGKARIRGAELSASLQLAGWQADLAATFLDHEDRDSGLALLRRPDELLSVNLQRQWQQLAVNAHLQVRGAQADIDPVNFARSSVAGSGVLDLTANWQWSAQLNSQIKLGNVLDKQYQVVDGYNTHGRTLLFATSYQF